MSAGRLDGELAAKAGLESVVNVIHLLGTILSVWESYGAYLSICLTLVPYSNRSFVHQIRSSKLFIQIVHQNRPSNSFIERVHLIRSSSSFIKYDQWNAERLSSIEEAAVIDWMSPSPVDRGSFRNETKRPKIFKQ